MLLLNINSEINIELPQNLKFAISELKKINRDKPSGDYKIIDEFLIFKISESLTEAAHLRRFESHRKFIDIHFVLRGSQIIEWASISDFNELQKYDAPNDIIFFDKQPQYSQQIFMRENSGNLAVFYPEDCHKPLCYINETPEKIKVCIAKIKI